MLNDMLCEYLSNLISKLAHLFFILIGAFIMILNKFNVNEFPFTLLLLMSITLSIFDVIFKNLTNYMINKTFYTILVYEKKFPHAYLKNQKYRRNIQKFRKNIDTFSKTYE